MSDKRASRLDPTIGKTVASEKFPNTMDDFWFVLNENTIINSFDFVTVDNLFESKTIGIIKELQAVATNRNFINYISNHNEISEIKEHQEEKKEGKYEKKNEQLFTIERSNTCILAKVAIMANIGKLEKEKDSISINFPVGVSKSVKFATEEEIKFALGIPQMENPIPAGIIPTTNGLEIPITLDITYLAGADTAHVNASGISGNGKSSYILFLLQSLYQTLKNMNQNVALIIFNTKEDDLLHVDQKEKNINQRAARLFDVLDLAIEPFENVTYFLPRGKDGKPNSIYIPKNYRTYSYGLNDVYDRLELLFSEPYDLHHDFSSIIYYIYESWPMKSNTKKSNVSTWTDLIEFNDYPDTILSNKSSLRSFLGRLQRFRKSNIFIDEKKTSTYLGKEIKNIKRSDIFVIDVATISSIEQQAFIVGDVMKSIDEMYASRYSNSENDNGLYNIDNESYQDNDQNDQPRLDYILIFIDEINRYVPKSQNGKMSSVSEQIMRTINAGRTRGTILFSAQQFKSATDFRLIQNTDLHITAKLGISELSTESYSMLDKSSKMNIARLNKGELVMIHSVFRHPIKIGFPKVTYKKST